MTKTPLATNCRVSYFEIKIIQSTDRCSVTVGIADRSHILNKSVGTMPGSIGYRGQDGKLCANGSTPIQLGSSFGKNDIIGCGIDYESRGIFFTKNGSSIGEESFSTNSKPSLPFFPAISMQSTGDIVEANFGNSPFVFSLKEYVSSRIGREFVRISSQQIDSSLPIEVIRKYFAYNAFVKSMELLPSVHDTDELSKCLVGTAHMRSHIRAAILSSDTENAKNMIERYFPSFFSSLDSDVKIIGSVMLYSQLVIDALEVGNSTAIVILKNHLSSFRDCSIAFVQQVLTDTCAMFCYPDPQIQMPYMFSNDRRQLTWRHVNRALIKGVISDPIELCIAHTISARRLQRFGPNPTQFTVTHSPSETLS
jgi:hypothetical protein